MIVQSFEDLRVFERAFNTAGMIFEDSKAWPVEERFALTDQIRRSSRAVCANIAESWSKRRYQRHFISKLTDADAEVSETRVWLRFALQCGYYDEEKFETYNLTYKSISGGLVKMMCSPEKWCINDRVGEPGLQIFVPHGSQ